MKERLFLSPDHRTRIEVCDCEGVLQVRLFNPEIRTMEGYARVRIERADLDRLADFFGDLLVDVEDGEARRAKPEGWEEL